MTISAEPIACDLFEFAPISLWEEDYSGFKCIFERLQAEQVTDLRTYLGEHPEAVVACMSSIRVLNVNLRNL
jgi:hypothetical protein